MIYKIRPLLPLEYSFLKEMLYTAIHVREGAVPPPKSIIEQPDLAKYISHWGQLHDIAFVAEKDKELIGAVWCRLLKGTKKGYGYIDEQTPELSLAIKKPYRNLGIGTKLMEATFEALQAQGTHQVSLSVDQDNIAVSLYKRLGFEIVETAETAFTMKKIL